MEVVEAVVRLPTAEAPTPLLMAAIAVVMTSPVSDVKVMAAMLRPKYKWKAKSRGRGYSEKISRQSPRDFHGQATGGGNN